MTQRLAGTGGDSLPSGELHAQLQRRAEGVVTLKSELRAVHLRRDEAGDRFIARMREEDELSWKDRVLRALFGREAAPIIERFAVVEDLGVVSRRVVTNAGVQFIALAFLNTNEAEAMNYHGSGTGSVAEAVGDTALGTEVESRATGTQSNPANGQYRTVGTVAYTATRAITEHGIFSATSAGTLLDRSVFTAINVVNGDSIQFTYTLTLSAGG
jgi:hypothetical protein